VIYYNKRLERFGTNYQTTIIYHAQTSRLAGSIDLKHDITSKFIQNMVKEALAQKQQRRK
jgi:hypothetical protein